MEKLDKILEGIDKHEIESESGWWETTAGKEFGVNKKAEIKAYFSEVENMDELTSHDKAFIKTLLIAKGGNTGKRIAKSIIIVHETPVEKARKSKTPYKTAPDYVDARLVHHSSVNKTGKL